MMDQDGLVYRAEMGFTHNELLNGLANAVVPYEVSREDELTYRLVCEDRMATLYLSPEKTRTIAAITLPVTNVTIEFKNFDVAHREMFLERFRKYLHRGGG